jgi:hypothetical protein
MLEYEDEEVKKIVAFVGSMKAQKGAQYSNIRTHCNWGQDKWIKHWKKAQQYLIKKTPTEIGWPYPKYFVKQKHEEKAKNQLWIEEMVSGLTKGKIQEITVPVTLMAKAIDEEMKRLHPMFEQIGWEATKKLFEKQSVVPPKQQKGIGVRVKKALSNKSKTPDVDFFFLQLMREIEYEKTQTELHEVKTRAGLQTVADHVKIHLVYDKNESLPSIDSQDIAELLCIVAKNLPAMTKKPWYLILACSMSEEDYVKPTD